MNHFVHDSPSPVLRTSFPQMGEVGFTLIELVIALGVMAALGMMISTVTTNAVATKNKTQVRADIAHILTVAALKMNDDMGQAFLADPTLQGKGGNYITGFQGDAEELAFTTMSHVHTVKNLAETDAVLVTYRLAKDDANRLNLIRHETRTLPKNLDKRGPGFIFIPDLKELRFQYYDSNSRDWKDRWSTDSAAAAGRLPSQVRIQLTVYGPEVEDGETRREYTRELVVPLALYRSKIGF